MKKKDKKFINLIIRYVVLLVIGIFGIELFSKLFLPLTKYPVYWALLHYNPTLIGNTIHVGPNIISIINACVAGSAYYFLLLLNLMTPGIVILRRLKILGISFFIFFIANVLRIIVLSFMYIHGSGLFNIVHEILWYFGSTALVILIWFWSVKRFNIENIPIYSDLKEIYSQSSLKKKN